jgi:chorismate mutase
VDEIQVIRKRIDALDLQLVALLNERAECAIAIGQVKQRTTLPIYEPDREATVLANVCAANRGPLEAEALRRVFERIIDEARRLQRVSPGKPPATPMTDEFGR